MISFFFFIDDLLCNFQDKNDEELKNHQKYFHLVNKDNYFFKELFTADIENKYSGRCDNFKMFFQTCRKKNHCFLSHHKQVGGTKFTNKCFKKNDHHVLLKKNFFLHKKFYDFYDAQKIMNDFLLSFETKFSTGDKVKIQASMKLINYQPTEIIDLDSKRIWMTDVYVYKFFNEFVKSQIKNDLMKRVIINGMSAGSWRFKRFENITVIVTKVNKNSVAFC